MPEAKADTNVPASGDNNPPVLEVRVARSLDDLMMVVAVRALVYMGEQNCPYAEEFDGNDLVATNLIGFVNGEPAATVRMRYFGGFAKHERTTVRPEFRGTGIGKAIVDYSLEYLRKKGFRTMYGHARADLREYWERRGFTVFSQPFRFSEHDYLPMAGPLGEHPDPLTVETDPLVLNRPEGEWERPGVLDLSAAR
jgi:predicted GNAT family N-acyltransferase